MKRNLLLVTVLLFALNGLKAQWTPTPLTWGALTSVGIKDICVVSSDEIWAIGYDGTGNDGNVDFIQKSIDGGGTWEEIPVTMPNSDQFAGIEVISSNHAFAASSDGTSGFFIETIDGGATWFNNELAFTPGSSWVDGVEFFDATRGFAYGDPQGGSFEIWYTTDAGETWTRSTSEILTTATEAGYNGPDCSSSVKGTGNGFIVTNKCRVLKTADYGETWSATVSSPYPIVAYGSVQVSAASDQNIIVRAGTGTTTITWLDYKYSINGGLTWSTLTGAALHGNISNVPGQSDMFISYEVDGGSTNKGISKSTDKGATWNDMGAGTTEQFIYAAFVNQHKGFVGGFDLVNVYNDVSSVNNLSNGKISVYPNPTNGLLNISMPETDKMNIVITDILGKIVMNINVDNSTKTIDLSSQSKGLYMVKVIAGNVTEVQKVLVK